MTNQSVERLFTAYEVVRQAEVDYWRLSAQLLGDGLVAIEDVAVIYGIHPQTARKRLAELHYRPTLPPSSSA